MNELVFRNANGVPMTNSWLVAETFGKQHLHVVRDIENLLSKLQEIDYQYNPNLDAHQALFLEQASDIAMPNGGTRTSKCYIMNRDGFTLLAMGYTGKKAMEFKLKYIAAFNAMEKKLNQSVQIHNELMQAQSEFMQTQMQMMNQMMQLCNSMMTRIERLEEKESHPEAKHKGQKVVEKPISLPSSPSEKVFKVRVLYDYKYIRTHFPDFVNLNQVVEELRLQGIGVRRSTVAAWLTERGYLEECSEYYNLPTQYAARKGWAVAIRGGIYPPNQQGRYRHTPYVSPQLVDLLIDDFKARRRGRIEAHQLALELEVGKEEQL